MTPTRFLYRAEHGTVPPPGDKTCWLCGAPTSHTAAFDKVVRSTLQDVARTRAGGTDAVCCEACDWYYEFKIMREGAKRAMGFFTKSIIVWPTRWEEWLRASMADQLLDWHANGVPADCILALNFSKQGHVIPTARINTEGDTRPWVSTDNGNARVPDDLPDVLAAIAALWIAGHPKTLIARGEPSPHVLRTAPRPADDLALLALVSRHAGTPVVDIATYVVTEDNRDRLARGATAVLERVRREPTARHLAADNRERGGRPEPQVPVPAQVVADAGGPRAHSGNDRKHDSGLQQQPLFPPGG